MNYGKARGMKLVGKYLPKLNPFQYIDVIETIDEWEQLKDKYGQTAIHRIDYPLGQLQVKRNAVQGMNGFAESIPSLIADVRRQSDVGVVLLAKTIHPSPPRHEYLGGFNILFCVDKHITIELVGKAFDGHELTQGLACHERYFIKWDDIPFMWTRSGMARRGAMQYLVSPTEYQAQRDARIKFLTEACRYQLDEVTNNVPELLIWIDDVIIRALLDELILPLRGQHLILKNDGLEIFGVQGNIVEIDGRFQIQPWEIFCPERWS